MMNLLLASIDNPGAAEIGGFLLLLVTVLGIFAKINGAKKTLVTDIIVQLRAEQQQQKESATPQPLIVSGHVEYVPRADFHKHAELNREEHKRLAESFAAALLRVEQKTEESSRRIEDAVHRQGREISEIKAQREANGDQLHVISSQLAEVSKDVSELSGVVHEMNRKGKA